MEYQLVQVGHNIREQTHRSPTKRRTSRMKWFGFNRLIPDWLLNFNSTIQFKLVKRDAALVISKLDMLAFIRPTPKIPAAREKNLWYPGYELR